MIDKSKTYRTRDGREVRIYSVDAGGRFPVHAAVKCEDRWVQDEWTATGNYNSPNDGWSIPHNSDLIEVKPRIKREVWVNVYPDRMGNPHENKAFVDKHRGKDCIACVRLTIDCDEGTGL